MSVEHPIDGSAAPAKVLGDIIVRALRDQRMLDPMNASGEAIARVLCEFAVERGRAARLWPDCVSLPDGVGDCEARNTFERIAKISCERAYREGRLTHGHVFEEETAEVLNARSEPALREELVQVAAKCLSWVLDLDRRAAARAANTTTTEETTNGEEARRREPEEAAAAAAGGADGGGEVGEG